MIKKIEGNIVVIVTALLKSYLLSIIENVICKRDLLLLSENMEIIGKSSSAIMWILMKLVNTSLVFLNIVKCSANSGTICTMMMWMLYKYLRSYKMTYKLLQLVTLKTSI